MTSQIKTVSYLEMEGLLSLFFYRKKSTGNMFSPLLQKTNTHGDVNSGKTSNKTRGGGELSSNNDADNFGETLQ